MGARGPVGKRPDLRHGHRSRAEQTAFDEVEPRSVTWPDPDPSWHELARDWYRSLGQSAQVAEFQQSDVMTARILADHVSRELSTRGPMTGNSLAAFLSGCSALLATAGDRRRAKLELARPDSDPDRHRLAAVSSIRDRKPDAGA